MPTIAEILARELDKPLAHVQNVIDLLDQGNTIPFIARYRKELHGSMDDTALRTLEDRLSYLRNLDQRRQEVKNAIDGQGKLTDELSAAIDSAATLAEVEDLYRPYKQKRRTRATVAREKGLEPLALLLLDQGRDCPAPEEAAQDYVDPEKGVETLADALQGANDIVAELLSDDAAIRKTLRELLRRQGHLRSLAATEEDTVYRLYYDFDQPIAKLAGHQVLAINRGEKEGVLSVTVLLDRELGLMTLRRAVVRPGSRAMEFIKAACEDAYDRLIYPSLEREARAALTEKAGEGFADKVGVAMYPGSGMVANYDYGFMMCTDDPAKQEGVWEAIKWFTNAEAQRIKLEMGGNIPVGPKVELTEEYREENPLTAQIVDLMGEAEYTYKTMNKLAYENLTYDGFSSLYPALVYDQITVDEMIQQMNDISAKNE